MSLDALGPSPRRMARAPPPPVAPKRFHLKDPPQDFLLKDVRRVASPEARKQSAVERLAADRAKYVRGGQTAPSTKPQQLVRPTSHPPVIRKQLVPPSCAIGCGQARASPQRPQRKAAPTTAGAQTGAPLLDLKHLTNLISGVGESPPTSSPSSTPTPTASSSSHSSEGGAGAEAEAGEGGARDSVGDENIEPSAAVASSSSARVESLPSTSSSSPTSPPTALLSSSPGQSLPGLLKAAGDNAPPTGPPAVTVRRVDVRPQVAPVRKAMPQARMGATAQRLQTMQQAQSHYMHLLKAQLAARNVPLLPKNGPLLAPAKLPPSAALAGAGVKGGLMGVTHRGALPTPAPLAHLPPHQNGSGSPPTMSPVIPCPQALLGTPAHPLPQGSPASPSGQLHMPVSSAQPPPPASGPSGCSIPLLPSPLVLGGTAGSRSSPSAAASSSSPAPSPSPCPSLLTRVSSTSSRKRPSLNRSKSDLSDRFSRAGADLERFFNYCGLDPTELEQLAQRPGSDIASVSMSVSRLRSASAPASECSQDEVAEEEEEEEDPRAPQRTPYGISVIERNARVIKWLYGMRQARDPARVANV